MNYDIKVPVFHTVRGVLKNGTRPESIIVGTTFAEFRNIIYNTKESEHLRFMQWMSELEHACTNKVIIELERE